MWDDGRRDFVPRMFVAFILARDGIAHSVAEMDARITKAYAREGGSQQHFALGFVIFWVFDGAREVFDRAPEALQGEDVGYGVRALVCGAVDWVRRAWGAGLVGDCGPGFEAMAEDVEARGGVDGGGHGAGIERVTDAKGRLEGAVGDAGLCFLGDEIEDGSAGRFATSSGGGWDGNEREEGFCYWKATAAVRG